MLLAAWAVVRKGVVSGEWSVIDRRD